MTLILEWFVPPSPVRFDWLVPATPADLVRGPVAVIIGPPGRSGDTATNYEHLQPSAAQTWIVNHNLGRKPAAVSVRSPGGLEVTAAVLHVSMNQLQISFAAPAAGSAMIQ